MEMNAENMYLLAYIETLKKENDALKEENIAASQKLESAKDTISRLKAEILVMKEVEKDHLVVAENKCRYQFEISKIRKNRNNAVNAARKLAQVSEEKNQEVKTWKTKYEELKKFVEDHNKQFDKKGFQIDLYLIITELTISI